MEFSYKSSTDYDWLDNSYIRVDAMGRQSVRIAANIKGLLSFAQQIKEFAESSDTSVYYEEHPGDLGEGSLLLEIAKIDHPGWKNP